MVLLSTCSSHLPLAEAPQGIWYEHCLLLSTWDIYSSSSDLESSTWLKVLADFFDSFFLCDLISSITDLGCAHCNKWFFLRHLLNFSRGRKLSLSLCSSAQWCIFFQLWFYQLPHQMLMLWFTSWLHSSLFLLPIFRRSVHCLIHHKQPVDANFCCLFLMSMFLSSWLTLLIRQCSKMETVGFCVISNW